MLVETIKYAIITNKIQTNTLTRLGDGWPNRSTCSTIIYPRGAVSSKCSLTIGTGITHH